MKKIMRLTISIALIMVYALDASGQKIMKLDADLKTKSQSLEAKRKGISTIGKYQFGPYEIVSGKAGWTTGRSSKKLFSFETNSESKQKSSFVFVVNNKDTLLVNTSTNTTVRETEIGNWSNVNENKDNLIALISPNADTTDWRMIVVFKSGSELEGNYVAEGSLTDGNANIEIRAVKLFEDGKAAFGKIVLGYEFFLDNIPIAAVQTYNKKLVWIHQDTNEGLKSILAASSACLLVHADAEMAKQ